jgi:PIN domain nuclease of toxin-antitoxin system
MKLLLDTHAFIWWDEDPARLGPAARQACFDPTTRLVLSVASVWEIQIKVMLGKLGLAKPLRQMIDDQMQQNGLEILAINLEHVLKLDALPVPHKDPFDRLLVAQAITEGCSVATHDSMISRYPVSIIW